jgi:hypothetical protein
MTIMKKTGLFFLFLLIVAPQLRAQEVVSYELGVGLKSQKTEQLYWENGIGADFTSDFLLNKRLHLKLSYISSRIGSAFNTNAIKQDNYIFGVNWHFMSQKDLQITAGLNTGFFHADMERSVFNILPHNSMLFSAETGLFYKFKMPLAVNLSLGYNFVNGNGVNTPGTLFPLYYQASFFYYFNIETKNLKREAPAKPEIKSNL